MCCVVRTSQCCVVQEISRAPARHFELTGAVPARRFEDLLRALTVERADIREAMVFALDNADCAAEA